MARLETRIIGGLRALKPMDEIKKEMLIATVCVPNCHLNSVLQRRIPRRGKSL
jgi:hypothetical protein